MNILISFLRWAYQILGGLSLLLASAVLSSLSFELPFKREMIGLKMDQWTSDPSTRLIIGGVGLALAVVFFTYVYIKSRMAREEPSIAFDNPDGEVSISIKAIEDFVGRIGRDFAEVKSLEPAIVARREGVHIQLKVELWSGTNIPKLTERIQNVIKSQVQNILGIENVQSVTLSVSKIIGREKDYQMPAQQDIFAGQSGLPREQEQANIPYQG